MGRSASTLDLVTDSRSPRSLPSADAGGATHSRRRRARRARRSAVHLGSGEPAWLSLRVKRCLEDRPSHSLLPNRTQFWDAPPALFRNYFTSTRLSSEPGHG